jgi:hypothetical protein
VEDIENKSSHGVFLTHIEDPKGNVDQTPTIVRLPLLLLLSVKLTLAISW